MPETEKRTLLLQYASPLEIALHIKILVASVKNNSFSFTKMR